VSVSLAVGEWVAVAVAMLLSRKGIHVATSHKVVQSGSPVVQYIAWLKKKIHNPNISIVLPIWPFSSRFSVSAARISFSLSLHMSGFCLLPYPDVPPCPTPLHPA
jgi:hypothetical protein